MYNSVLTPHNDLIRRTRKKKVLDQYSREVIGGSSLVGKTGEQRSIEREQVLRSPRDDGS